MHAPQSQQFNLPSVCTFIPYPDEADDDSWFICKLQEFNRRISRGADMDEE